MNKWKSLYIAQMNLLEQYNEILERISSDIWNETDDEIVNMINRLYKLPNIDFDFFQKAVDEYGINERDSLVLLFNNAGTVLTWLLQSKDHYNNWKDVPINFIEEFLELCEEEQQIAESYIRNYEYNIEDIYSAKNIINDHIGDMTIEEFVNGIMGDLSKYLIGNYDVSLDYEACLDAIISDSQYLIIRLDKDYIRVFRY